MNRNHALKTRKANKSTELNPPANPALLNVVTFTFRAHENAVIDSRGVDWAPPESENKEMYNK